jgi:RHH-type proline utilization regulon transcriptional repressor/proline dehydrogenase/delta 1-pyrroline-5-carboxylate dehydrogenase
MAKKSPRKTRPSKAAADPPPPAAPKRAKPRRKAAASVSGGESSPALQAQVESQTQEIGRELWEQLSRRRPTIFERRWWLDHILQWAMEDETVKVQMFRFVDVLPMLRTHEQVTQHLQEYFEEVSSHLPWAGRLVLNMSPADSLAGKALALSARKNARKMAERFIAGTKVEEVLLSVTRLRKQGLAFTLDLLGEAVVSETEADAYQRAYLELLEGLAPQVNDWPEASLLDRDEGGLIPRCNVSLKLSALYSRFKPIDPAGSAEGVKERLRPILRAARAHDAYVHVDMEHYAYKDLTLDIFQQVLMEEEFRDWPDCGIVVQAYLPEAGADLERLLAWVQDRGTPIWVRLVKGAYWDYETVVSAYRGWPCPVFTEKWQSDDNFERQTEFLFRHRQWLRPAIASHNLRSLAHAIAWSRALEVPHGAWEIQMLYGMAEEQQQLFSERGHRVRVYTPFGELIPGMAYLVRRLLENTSNDSFLRHAYDESASVEDLFRRPRDAGAAWRDSSTFPVETH